MVFCAMLYFLFFVTQFFVKSWLSLNTVLFVLGAISGKFALLKIFISIVIESQ